MKRIYALILLVSLASAIHAQSTCRSAYDTNFNNDYQGTSYFPGPMTVMLNTPFNGTIESGTDIDYYKFYITTSGTIRLMLTNLPANYNLRLVNSLGYSIATSANSGNTSEVINYSVVGGNYYYALVYPANKRTFNPNACYTLNIATITATRMMEQSGGDVIEGQVKVDIFPNPAGEVVNLNVQGYEGFLRISMMNILGERVFEHVYSDQNIRLDLSSLQRGLYLVDVSGDNGLIKREKLILK